MSPAEQAIADELMVLGKPRGATLLAVLLPGKDKSDPLGETGYILAKVERDGVVYGDARPFTERSPEWVLNYGSDLIAGGWLERMPDVDAAIERLNDRPR